MANQTDFYTLRARIAALEAGIALAEMEIKGGAGSGNWGHAGRPGQKGGSAPVKGPTARSMADNINPAMSLSSGKDAAARRMKRKFEDGGLAKFYDALNSPKTPLNEKYAMVEARMKGKFNDYKPARLPGEIPVVDTWSMSMHEFSTKGKLTLFEENGGLNFAPVLRGDDGKYYTGAMGTIRQVKPVFDNQAIRDGLGERSNKQLAAFKEQGDFGLDLMEVPGLVQRGKKGTKITQVGATAFNKLVEGGLVQQIVVIGPSGRGRYLLTDLGKQVLGD